MPNPNQTPQEKQRAARAAALAALSQPAKDAAAAKVARMALALRNVALAAAALRTLPGGGAAADSLEKMLDRAVNKGGRFYVEAGKLRRTTPPPAPPEVGFGFLLSVAPWAMRAVGPAVQAARVGIGRFGPALATNLRTAVGWASGKIGPVLAAVKANPAFSKATALAGKALTAASLLLGIGGAVKAVSPKTAAEVESTAVATIRAARRRGGAIARKTATAVEKGIDAAAAAPSQISSGLKWGAAATALAVLAAKFL